MLHFTSLLKQSGAFRIFCLSCLLLGALYFAASKINQRDGLADFRVYYDAATALVNGNEVYGIPFGVGSGYYKYSPVATFPFIPLTLLPFKIAAAAYYLLVVCGIILFFGMLIRWMVNHFHWNKNQAWFLFLLLFFMLDHLERELHLGNVNLFLMILVFTAFRSMEKKRKWISGMLIGISLLYKPHFLILLPWLLLNREWKILSSTFITVAVGLFLPVVFLHWNVNLNLLSDWVSAMQSHNIALENSPNTLYGIVQHFALTPLNVEGGNGVVIAVLALAVSAFLWWMKKNRMSFSQPSDYLFIEFFTLVAVIPNLAHTDTEHFMWTMPLIAFSIMCLLNAEVQCRWIFVVMLFLAFVPYCINTPDLLGKQTALLFENGWIGIANFVLIITSILLWQSNKMTKEKAPV